MGQVLLKSIKHSLWDAARTCLATVPPGAPHLSISLRCPSWEGLSSTWVTPTPVPSASCVPKKLYLLDGEDTQADPLPTQSSRGWPRHQPRIPVPGARSGGAERSLIKTRRHGRACFFWVIIHLKNCTVRQRQRRALSHPKGCGHYTMIRPHPAPPTTINTQPRAGSSKYCISNQETPAFSAHMKKPRRCVPTRTPLRADLHRTRQAEVVFCP